MPIVHPTYFVAAAVAFTNCSYFTNVVVPSTDTTPPSPFVGLYDFATGQYDQEAFASGNPFDYAIPDPTKAYLAVAAGIDAGGVQSVEIQGSFSGTCVVPNGSGGYDYNDFEVTIDQTGTQAGGIGSTVSDGAYVYWYVDWSASAFKYCPGGPATKQYAMILPTVSWRAKVTDYHGNVSGTPLSTVYYPGWVYNAYYG